MAEVADFGMCDFAFFHLDLEFVHLKAFYDGLYVTDVLHDILLKIIMSST